MDFEQSVEALRRDLATYVRADGPDGIPWNWLAAALSTVLSDHSSGISRAVLLAELEAQWYRIESGQVLQEETHRTLAPLLSRGAKPAQDAVFNLLISGMERIPETGIWLWRVTGAPGPPDTGVPPGSRDGLGQRSARTEAHLDAFVHQRYYPMIEATEFEGFFDRKRTLYVTNLRMADRGGSGGSGRPVHTLLPTTSLAFELRIKGDPGLPPALRPHTDDQLLQNLFGVCFAGGQFRKCGSPLFNADQLWCRVEEIYQEGEAQRHGRPAINQLVRCVLEHEEPTVVVNITLWDEDIAMARLWMPNCYIGFLCPASQTRVSETELNVEYGSQTISFVTRPIRSPADAYASQLSVERNELGLLDYRRFARRVRLCECRGDMVNLTVLARVVAVSDNVPFADARGVTSRYAVRVDDGTAVRDVTLWGGLGRQAPALRPGQLVLWHSLDAGDENGEVILNGSGDEGSRLFNISAMGGLLASSMLRQYTFLARLPTAANRYAKACIVDIAAAGEHLRDARDRLAATMLIHGDCGRRVVRSDSPHCSSRLDSPADVYRFDCPSCGSTGLEHGETASAFVVSIVIDDGTRLVVARATELAAMDAIGITPEQFLALPCADEQQGALARPLGREVAVSITTYCEPLSAESDIRIDAVCAASAIGMPTASA
ncbi:hypothetical protein LPJ61_002628 [Coemansia biformis]|uniref:Cell division control protein 24 OB domain-containing protein n=1 Tax=Coemansia biformis TaxID=1286918 RepID=A0A9W7YCR1_9FUNG|nr:hypothetical protein LPJ61_002628 [Coemansia biformis]